MNRPYHPRTDCFRTRAGFTLIELLVVMAIIGIIVSLTAAAAIQVLAYQRSANTQATVKVVGTFLERQWSAVRDQASDDAKAGKIPASVYAIAGGDTARAKVIWTILRFRQQFPMNYSEALTPWQLPVQLQVSNPIKPQDLPSVYASDLSSAGISSGSGTASFDASPPGWPAESSVMLWLALRKSRGGNQMNDDSLPSSALIEVPVGLRAIVDAWGKPLVFYRHPKPLDNGPAAELNASSASADKIKRDPLDPTGTLIDPVWNSWANYSSQQGVFWFEQFCYPVHTGTGAQYKPSAAYSMPTIVSAGRDGVLGLVQQPYVLPQLNLNLGNSPLLPDLMSVDTNNSTAWTDNIYSFRLRQGARGD